MARRIKTATAVRQGQGAGLARSEWAFVVAGVGLIFAAHFLYGALVTATSMVFAVLASGLLVWTLAVPALRGGLADARGLTLPAVGFAAVIIFCLLSLTPYLPGGPHPVWDYTGVGAPAVTINKSWTIVQTIRLLALGCLFAVGVSTGGSSRRGRAAITVMLVIGVVFSLWAFLGGVSGAIPQSQGRRLEAHFLDPNTAGTFFAVMLMMGLAMMFERLQRAAPGKRVAAVGPWVAANLLFLVCLMTSGSRGAAVAALTGGALLVLTRMLSGDRRLSRGALVGFVVAAAGMVAIYYSGSIVADRFTRVEEDSIWRAVIWSEHWKAFQAAPLSGYGLGTSETVNRSITSVSNFQHMWNIRSLLNVYLQWLEQAGVIGAALMFATIAAIIATTVSGLLKGARGQLLVLGLLAADVVFLVHGMTDFGLETPSMSMLWAYLLGLQFTLSQRRPVS